MFKQTALLAAGLGLILGAGLASAAPVAIANHSFESNFDDWTNDSASIKTPPSDNLGTAPDGSKVAFIFAENRGASQVLTTDVAANTTYTLQMDYLGRTDGEGAITSYLAIGYGDNGFEGAGSVELDRINSGEAGADIPTSGLGEFKTWTLTVTTGAVVPAGESLWIAFGSGPVNNGSSGYDNFRLDATLVPEPTSLALLGLGGLLIARRRRG